MRFRGSSSFIKKAVIVGTGLTVLLVTALFIIVYAQSDDSAYRASIRNGNHYLENGDYLMAMNYFDEAAKYNAKLVSEYLAVYRGFKEANNIWRAREALEKAYYNALKNSPERLDEVRIEFAAFLVEIYENYFKPENNYLGALEWFGDWPFTLDDDVLMEKYEEVLSFLAVDEQTSSTNGTAFLAPTAMPTPAPEIISTQPPTSTPGEELSASGASGSTRGSTSTATQARRGPATEVPTKEEATPSPTPEPEPPTPSPTPSIKPTPTPTPKPTYRVTKTPTPTPTLRPQRTMTPTPTPRPHTSGAPSERPTNTAPRTPRTGHPRTPATPRPVVMGTYSYTIVNGTDENLRLPCYYYIAFQMVVYDADDIAVSYTTSGRGTITVKPRGKTVVSFVDADIETAPKQSEAWEKVTYYPSEQALAPVELVEGGTYTLMNTTGKNQIAKFPSGTKHYYVSYKEDGSISGFSSKGRMTASVPAGGWSVITIAEGGGTAYLPTLENNCLKVTPGGDALKVQLLSAGQKYIVRSNSENDVKVAISGNFMINLYYANYYDSNGMQKGREEVRGRDMKVLSHGWTEVTIGSVNLTFCYPSSWAVTFEQQIGGAEE